MVLREEVGQAGLDIYGSHGCLLYKPGNDSGMIW